jgi:hypothetical protein
MPVFRAGVWHEQPVVFAEPKISAQLLISDTTRRNHLAQPSCFFACIFVWLSIRIFIRIKIQEDFMTAILASHNGGIDKTTTAVRLATSPQMLAPSLQLGGDGNRDAPPWTQRGKGVPLSATDATAASTVA